VSAHTSPNARADSNASLLWNMMKAGDTYLNRQRAGTLLFGK